MRAVFFDFDGVVLDSVNVKTEAFGDLFAHYGETIRKLVVEYHLAHGGVSRFEKFRYYFCELLRQPVDEAEIEMLGRQFTELTMSKILEAPYIPGARVTLEALKEKNIPAFVASGTPQDDLEQIVDARNLRGFFWETHGSPRKKIEIVRDVCSRFGFLPDECLFIGDAMTDYVVAKECGMPFLGVTGVDSADFPEGTRVTEVLSYEVLQSARACR